MTFNILVVEDEVDFCEVLVDLLRLKGYLASGIDSIRSYQAIQNPTEFDFIILDRTLPDGDGLCILEAHRKIANIPILILSGLGQVDERVKGLDADADYYLVKPVVMPELLAIIARYARQATTNDIQNGWLIDPHHWELHAPGNIVVKLTNSELHFLSCFKNATGQKVERDEIISRLGFRPEVYDIRRLESMISRLRNKVRDSGVEEFPLITVYGSGYAFNAALKLIDTSASLKT